jgi:hypothetical protein
MEDGAMEDGAMGLAVKKDCPTPEIGPVSRPPGPKVFHIKDKSSQRWESSAVQRKHSLDWDKTWGTWQDNGKVRDDDREIDPRSPHGE